MKKVITLIIIVFIAAGCGKKEEKIKENTPENVKTQEVRIAGESSGEKGADTLKYLIKKYSKSYNGCNDTAFGCTYLKAEYPVFTSGDYKDRINSVLMAQMTDSVFSVEGNPPNRTFDGLASALFKEYEIRKSDNPDFEAGYTLEINGSVVHNRNGLLTVAVSDYSYTGGAHPNTFTKYFVFDINTGNILRPSDIFEKGFEKKLNKLIEKKLRIQFEIPDGKPLTEVLFENKIEFNNNFAVTKEGIEFLYNRYEIMAYVYGEAEIKFSYDELKDILKEKYYIKK